MRGAKPEKRQTLPDSVFGDRQITEFVNHLMYGGKKNLAYSIFYRAPDVVKDEISQEERNAPKIRRIALDNVTPHVKVKFRRIGGATFRTPTEIRSERRESISMKNLIILARKRGGKTMADKLAVEVMNAYNGRGGAFRRKEDVYRIAETNRAFAHFRFQSVTNQESMSATHSRLEQTRNTGIMAHIDAGRTTISEHILFYTGLTRKVGEVHDGVAMMDWVEQEQKHGITVISAVTTTLWTYGDEKYKINPIDTPGHADFTVEVEHSLRVLGGAVATFCAVGGVQPQSETVWRQADKYGVLRIAYISKMNRSGTNFYGVQRQMAEMLGAKTCPIQIPVGEEDSFKGVIDLITMKAITRHDETMGAEYEIDGIPDSLRANAGEWRDKLLETLAETDKTLTEKYFEDPSTITRDEVRVAIHKATLAMEIFPVLCGSSFKNKGIQTPLGAACVYLPDPVDTPKVVGHTIDSNREEVHEADPETPMSASAFKITIDPFTGCLCFFRVYSGCIDAGSYVFSSRSGKKERISRLFQMHPNHQNPIGTIGTGDIGADVGFKDIRMGGAFCNENVPLVLESIGFPDLVIDVAVESKTQKDTDRPGAGLSKLAEKDPTFVVKTNEETGQTVISDMSEPHLDITIDRLKRELKVEYNQGRPQVIYKEAVTQAVNLREVYKKQSGGRGEFADTIIKFSPTDENFDGTLQFVDEVKGSDIPKESISSVQKGFEKAAKSGILANYPLDSLKVILVDGSFHPVDSDQLSFEVVAMMVFRGASEKTSPVLMEPIMQLGVVTPEESMGDVINDLNRCRGWVKGSEVNRLSAQVIKAKVPLDKMFGYVIVLRTITNGRAFSTMSFSHYTEVSSSIAKKIPEELNGRIDLIK